MHCNAALGDLGLYQQRTSADYEYSPAVWLQHVLCNWVAWNGLVIREYSNGVFALSRWSDLCWGSSALSLLGSRPVLRQMHWAQVCQFRRASEYLSYQCFSQRQIGLSTLSLWWLLAHLSTASPGEHTSSSQLWTQPSFRSFTYFFPKLAVGLWKVSFALSSILEDPGQLHTWRSRCRVRIGAHHWWRSRQGFASEGCPACWIARSRWDSWSQFWRSISPCGKAFDAIIFIRWSRDTSIDGTMRPRPKLVAVELHESYRAFDFSYLVYYIDFSIRICTSYLRGYSRSRLN